MIGSVSVSSSSGEVVNEAAVSVRAVETVDVETIVFVLRGSDNDTSSITLSSSRP